MMAAEREREPHDWDALSIFQHKYKIPSIKTDQSRWDKAWEKTLRTLSGSEDVFPMLSIFWKQDESEDRRISSTEMSEGLFKEVCEFQEIVVRFEEHLDESDSFVIAWLLLDEAERKRHLFNGMKDTCQQASLHHDARALCPEITTTAMLKQNGKAFTDFARDFVTAAKEAGDDVYSLPSEWWSSAVNMSEPWPEDIKFIFTQLSLQRNEFIGHFIVNTLMSILHDLSYGSPGMDKATDVLKVDGDFALGWAKALSSKRDKPLIRCQNCTKTSEEIKGNPKFMVCSTCKSKLDFVVHYCSQACQKADWRNHKKHCGKEKIAKKLPGTIHDRFWAYPDTTEAFRSVESTPGNDVPLIDMGFGTPHPSRPHSPALQRQLSLLEGDKNADYYLFDDADRPIRFMLYETSIKMSFRLLRSEAMFGAEPAGLEAMAEYMIKMMAGQPGLSRAGILAQLEREYGGGVAAKVATFEAQGRERGYEPGRTFLETMSASMRTVMAPRFPGLM